MPQIPQYREQGSAEGGGLGPSPIGDRGEGDLFALGNQLEADRQRMRDSEINRTLTQRTSELRLGTEQDYLSQQSVTDATEGFTPRVLKSFDERRTSIAKNISDREARNAFIDHVDSNVRPQLEARALAFENEQGISKRLTEATDSLDRQTAAVELHPESWIDTGLEAMRGIDAVGLTPAANAEARSKASKAIRFAAARGFAKADPALALAKIARTDSGDPVFDSLDVSERHQLETFTKQKYAENLSEGIVNAYRNDAQAGTKALIALSTSKDIPADVRNAAASDARTGFGLLHAERREQYNDQVTEFERSITQGTPGIDAEQRATALYRRGAYTAEQYTNVLQAVDQARIEAAKHGAELVTVENAIATGQRLDPKNEKIVKAVDTWFTNATTKNGIQPGTDEWINSAAALANRTNILPPEAMSWARKTILSGEPQLAVPAANAIARFAEAAPNAYAYFDDPQLKAQAEGIDSMVRAGVSPAKAVEIARANVYDIPKPRQEALKADYTKKKYAGENTGKLQSYLDSDDNFDRSFGPRGSPAPPLGMQDEFGSLVRQYFDYTNGDISRARDLAWKDLRGTYGYSEVNGEPEILKYAPELTFPGIDVKVIRSDIEDSAKAAGVTTPVRLTPSRITGDTHGLLWNLSTVDKDGATEVLLDDRNRPLQYAIPTDTQTYLAAQEAAKAKAVGDARAESARRRATAEAAQAIDPLKNEFLQ
jgi:hypothetical protein